MRIVEMICERLDIQERDESGGEEGPRWSNFDFVFQAFKLLLAAELIFETKRNLTSNNFEQ